MPGRCSIPGLAQPESAGSTASAWCLPTSRLGTGAFQMPLQVQSLKIGNVMEAVHFLSSTTVKTRFFVLATTRPPYPLVRATMLRRLREHPIACEPTCARPVAREVLKYICRSMIRTVPRSAHTPPEPRRLPLSRDPLRGLRRLARPMSEFFVIRPSLPRELQTLTMSVSPATTVL